MSLRTSSPQMETNFKLSRLKKSDCFVAFTSRPCLTPLLGLKSIMSSEIIELKLFLMLHIQCECVQGRITAERCEPREQTSSCALRRRQALRLHVLHSSSLCIRLPARIMLLSSSDVYRRSFSAVFYNLPCCNKKRG